LDREKRGETKIDDNREIDLTFQLNPFNDRIRENVDSRLSVLTISPLDRLVERYQGRVRRGRTINHPRIQISASR